MAKPFDAATKHLLELDPIAWLNLLGLPSNPAEVIEADVATVSAAADKVMRIQSETPSLVHWEFQAGYDVTLPDRALLYSVLLRHRHNLPVRTVVLLLRPDADGSHMTGIVTCMHDRDDTYLTFTYQTLRLWQLPVDEILSGGLGTLPLAPLAKIKRADLPSIIAHMKRRFEDEAVLSEIGELWTAAGVLMGLRYPAKLIREIMQGVGNMKESTFYQMILQEGEALGIQKGEALGIQKGEALGRAEEARAVLRRLGALRCGQPDEETKRAIEAIQDVETLELLLERLLKVESWQELLTTDNLEEEKLTNG